MVSRVFPVSLFLLVLCASPAVLAAEAVTIFSGGADARNCYHAAEFAARGMFVSGGDLRTCDRAVDDVTLKRRDQAGTFVNRAIVETSLHRYQDAFADYHRAIKIMPDLPEPYVGRGNIYFLAGKLDKAIADYNHALDLHLTREHIAYINRGMAYEKQGRFDVAEEDYRRALAEQPDWKLAQQKLDRVLAKQAAEEVR